MRTAILCVLLWPAAGFAEEWQTLRTDDEITRALVGRTVTYDAHTLQHFGAGGDTQYVTDRAADGRWAARGGQYCSVWPPSDIWACYDLALLGDAVRFTAADRTVSTGVFAR